MNRGYHVAIKCPIDITYDRLTMTKEGETCVLSTNTDEEDKMEWRTMTVLNPHQYINLSLYFFGYIDSDLLLTRVSQSDLEDNCKMSQTPSRMCLCRYLYQNNSLEM